MPDVHETAIVDAQARLHEGVYVGPYCIVGPRVELGPGVRLEAHVAVAGTTAIGANSTVFPFSSIGHPPQDLKYGGEESRLVIGQKNVIREHVTMNPGTSFGGLETRVGDACLFMVGAHVAHDCRIGDNVVMVNNATLGGHVSVGEFAIVGGLAAVHQFVRIGRHAMIGGMSGVENDVIPFGSVMGNRAHLSGINIIGLKRRGFSRDDVHGLRSAYRLLFAPEGTMAERLADVAEQYHDAALVMEIVDFLGAGSSRAFCQPKVERAA